MEFVAVFVVLLVFGPPLLIVPVLLALCGIGMFASEGARQARCAFDCPVTGRTVRAEFSVPPGAGRPDSVVSCSAFPHPRTVACAQTCLEAAGVRWSPPISVFGRWALTSDGVRGFGDAARPAA